jgi:hypothetical protein
VKRVSIALYHEARKTDEPFKFSFCVCSTVQTFVFREAVIIPLELLRNKMLVRVPGPWWSIYVRPDSGGGRAHDLPGIGAIVNDDRLGVRGLCTVAVQNCHETDKRKRL